MERESGLTIAKLHVNGGITNSDLCMQIQADILGKSVGRLCTVLEKDNQGLWRVCREASRQRADRIGRCLLCSTGHRHGGLCTSAHVSPSRGGRRRTKDAHLYSANHLWRYVLCSAMQASNDAAPCLSCTSSAFSGRARDSSEAVETSGHPMHTLFLTQASKLPQLQY